MNIKFVFQQIFPVEGIRIVFAIFPRRFNAKSYAFCNILPESIEISFIGHNPSWQ